MKTIAESGTTTLDHKTLSLVSEIGGSITIVDSPKGFVIWNTLGGKLNTTIEDNGATVRIRKTEKKEG